MIGSSAPIARYQITSQHVTHDGWAVQMRAFKLVVGDSGWIAISECNVSSTAYLALPMPRSSGCALEGGEMGITNNNRPMAHTCKPRSKCPKEDSLLSGDLHLRVQRRKGLESSLT
jgi:hypothetical protein